MSDKLSNIRGTLDTIEDYYANEEYSMNDSYTRGKLTSKVSDLLDQEKMNRKLEDFRVICDETNNTYQDIQNGKINLNVIIKPTKAVEMINIKIGEPEKTKWVLRKDSEDYVFEKLDDDTISITHYSSKGVMPIPFNDIEFARRKWILLKDNGFVVVED